MDELCNNCELRRPPLVTLPVQDARFTKHLHPAFSKYLRTCTAQEKTFAETAALLSRLMARRANSFRNMIGFRSVRKLNSSLCRLLRVDLKRDLEHFTSAIDDEFVTELPSRNCLDFVLVRLLTVYQIHKRIRDCCLDAAEYFSQMLSMNFFLEICTLLLATFAKLRSLSAQLGNKVVRLYEELLRYRMSFPWQGPHELIPNGLQLPPSLTPFATTADVATSAAAAALSTSSPSTPTTPKVTLQMCEQLPVMCGAYTPKVRQPKVEMGTAIERTATKTTTTTTAASHKGDFSVAALSTIDGVKKFLVSENRARKATPKTCLTNGVPPHEWAGAQKLFERRLAANEHKRALSVFVKFISTKVKGIQ